MCIYIYIYIYIYIAALLRRPRLSWTWEPYVIYNIVTHESLYIYIYIHITVY